MGHDHISQTIYPPEAGAGGSWDEGETHMFGTGGHGSVRVLYDLAGVIARDDQQRMQVYFYDAYGKVLFLAVPHLRLTPYHSQLTFTVVKRLTSALVSSTWKHGSIRQKLGGS